MGSLYKLTVTMGRETALENGSRTRPDIIDSVKSGHTDTLELAHIVPRLPDLGYDEVYKDLGIKTVNNPPTRRTPKNVRQVVARLRGILPDLPEVGDEFDFPCTRKEVRGLIAFLEKNATKCEKTGEFIWFEYS